MGSGTVQFVTNVDAGLQPQLVRLNVLLMTVHMTLPFVMEMGFAGSGNLEMVFVTAAQKIR